MRTKRIYEDHEIWKEYALLSQNGICREYALFGIVLTQIWLRQMRFDSDFTQTSGQKNGDWSLWSSVAVRLSSVLSPQSSVLRSSGCNKLYKCGRQKISKKCTFVAERLKTAVLLQNLDLRHFCRECREKHNIRVSRTKFWENLLMRTSRKLWQPAIKYYFKP